MRESIWKRHTRGWRSCSRGGEYNVAHIGARTAAVRRRVGRNGRTLGFLFSQEPATPPRGAVYSSTAAARNGCRTTICT